MKYLTTNSIVLVFCMFANCNQIDVFQDVEATDRISFRDADYIARDVPSLYNYVDSADDGDIIWLNENVEFDLSKTPTLNIIKQIILASSRGIKDSEGALLFSNNEDLNSCPKIQVNADNVRITGIRLIGPDSEVGDSFYVPQVVIGVACLSYDNFHIDHCEISAWSYAGVSINGSTNSKISNNYIHHNRRIGLGYGIQLYGNSDALITYNTFDNNKHDIAGTGLNGQSYEAAYNTVLNQGNSHSFDMHGEWESDRVPGSEYAGNTIYIHHNTFCNGTRYASVKVRGIPFNYALIEHNSFPHSSENLAVIQQYFFGNFTVRNNTFDKVASMIKQDTIFFNTQIEANIFNDSVNRTNGYPRQNTDKYQESKYNSVKNAYYHSINKVSEKGLSSSDSLIRCLCNWPLIGLELIE